MRRILWFRRDLRVEDNPLLSLEGEVLPIFIFDRNILETVEKNDRRVSFIFEQVIKLKDDLKRRGLDLALFYGEPQEVFEHLLPLFSADEICASGDFDSSALERDRLISHLIPFRHMHDTYVFRPEELLKDNGMPYLLFTPFYKRAKARFTPAHMQLCLLAVQELATFQYEHLHLIEQETLTKVVPQLESIGFEHVYHGVMPPQKLLESFKQKLGRYSDERDLLDSNTTSQLGVHLRFGTLGIRALLRWLAERKSEGTDTEPFFRQLMFRDFYAHMLAHFPRLQKENFKYAFQGIPDDARFKAFCEGRTGVPVVDAGIRQLLETGLMHNRARMICASFFTKDLLLPWQWGEAFFAKHLLDYDAASNILSWQWSAGTGVDPQPYFRIFNPYLQSKKFDPQGRYIKKWVSELDDIDSKRLHDESWLFTHTPEGYRVPIVRHKEAAQTALKHFKSDS
jgi:deoxyribodipyrimidine photo-lyase